LLSRAMMPAARANASVSSTFFLALGISHNPCHRGGWPQKKKRGLTQGV
jgi:hypothetical protein